MADSSILVLTRKGVARSSGRVKTCSTCKYWTRHSPDGDKYGQPVPTNMGACSFPRFSFHNDMGRNSEGVADGILYFDGSGYMADIWFGQDFGCIHHEPK